MRRIPGPSGVTAFVRSSYRRKLGVALLVVFLVAGMAAIGLYVQIGGSLNEDVEGSLTASADAEAGELTQWDTRNRLVAQVLSEHPVYGTDDRDAVRAYLEDQRATREEAEIVDVYVIDRRSRTVETSTKPSMEGTPTSELPWSERLEFTDFDDVRQTPTHETSEGESVVGYVTPIRQQPGSLLVVTTGTASVFDGFADPIDDGFTRVVDSNGTVVFADDESETLRQYYDGEARPEAVRYGLRGESGFVAESAPTGSAPDEEPYVAAYTPVDGTDWVVIKHAPESEAFALVESTRTWIGIASAFMLVGFLAVVLGLGADVTGSLSRLSRRADRIRGGEHDVSFETERPDEFGDLNRAFAEMRDTLRKRLEELRSTRDRLERSNTALQERSEMVSVLNRVLRHNVRNDINVIAGRANLLSEELPADGQSATIDADRYRDELETIRRAAHALAEISEQTKRMEQLLDDENTRSRAFDPTEEIERGLERVRDDHPDATVTVSVDDDAPERVRGDRMLPATITDVVEQIITHNDAVTVDVSVSSGADGGVRITVDDDGHGLPATDVKAVDFGRETPLEHADGVAVWCLKWTVEKNDGTLEIDREDVTMAVELPPPDAA